MFTFLNIAMYVNEVTKMIKTIQKKHLALILGLTAFIFCINTPVAYAVAEEAAGTVILSSSEDPYYTLAEEISQAEGIPIFGTLKEAEQVNPAYLLWVASPDTLTESMLADFAYGLKSLESSISVGVISGSDIEDARRLWAEPKQVQNQSYALINATKGYTGIVPDIIYDDGEQTEVTDVTMDNILSTLSEAGIIQITIEGSENLWFNSELDITVYNTDIPELGPCVIQNYACNTFRPWAKSSIALACIEKGALAYCGFIYPSISGTRFGGYTSTDMINTWPQFTLGQIVQIQNQITMRSYADRPHYFMIGDPRIYCRSESPYEVVSDKKDGSDRMIELSDLEPGLVPIYIEGGAGYNFVQVQGLTAQSMDSPYANKLLEMIDINNDKYIIIDNENSNVTIELKKNVPILWTLQNLFIGFFDAIVVRNWKSNASPVAIILISLVLIIGLVKKRHTTRNLMLGAGVGAGMALIAITYILIRQDAIAITNYPVRVNWSFIAGIFMLSGYGALKFLGAKKTGGRIWAVLAANLNALFTFVILCGLVLVAKIAVEEQIAGINRPGHPYVAAGITLLVGGILYTVLYFILNKLAGKGSATSEGE